MWKSREISSEWKKEKKYILIKSWELCVLKILISTYSSNYDFGLSCVLWYLNLLKIEESIIIYSLQLKGKLKMKLQWRKAEEAEKRLENHV